MKKVSIILLVTLTSAINAAERQDPRLLTALSALRKGGLWSQESIDAAKRIADKVIADKVIAESEAAKAKETKETKEGK